MKLGCFRYKGKADFFFGKVESDRVFSIDENSGQGLTDSPLAELEILPPILPTKIVCVGLNYKRHAAEMKMQIPADPVLFLKPPSAILGSGGTIRYPEMSGRVDYEAELGVVIKSEARDIGVAEADSYILGYTAFNDVTARDLQSKDGQWTRAKGFDTFAPYGPFIETELEHPNNLKIQAILNDKVVQESNTSDMIFTVRELVSFISRVMTLYPGDIIATGTPEGIGPMQPGDRITIRIEGLDDLVNTLE